MKYKSVRRFRSVEEAKNFFKTDNAYMIEKEGNSKYSETRVKGFDWWRVGSHTVLIKNSNPLDLLEFELKNIDWKNLPTFASINSRHEYIKHKIISIGFDYGYFGLPEFTCKGFDGYKRVDAGWFCKNKPYYAFEVDGTVKTTSVLKLNRLPSYVTKVVVSKSPNKAKIRRRVRKYLPDDIFHIDAELYESDRF